jgi:hypothetical protein
MPSIGRVRRMFACMSRLTWNRNLSQAHTRVVPISPSERFSRSSNNHKLLLGLRRTCSRHDTTTISRLNDLTSHAASLKHILHSRPTTTSTAPSSSGVGGDFITMQTSTVELKSNSKARRNTLSGNVSKQKFPPEVLNPNMPSRRACPSSENKAREISSTAQVHSSFSRCFFPST